MSSDRSANLLKEGPGYQKVHIIYSRILSFRASNKPGTRWSGLRALRGIPFLIPWEGLYSPNSIVVQVLIAPRRGKHLDVLSLSICGRLFQYCIYGAECTCQNIHDLLP